MQPLVLSGLAENHIWPAILNDLKIDATGSEVGEVAAAVDG